MLDVCYLLHEFLVDGEAACGIDDDDVIGVSLGVTDGVEGYLYGVGGSWFDIYGDVYLPGEYAELLHGCGTEGVAGSEEGLLGSLVLEHLGELAGHGGLTGSVEACHEDDGGVADTAGEVEVYGLAAHEGCEFVVDYLDHELLGLDGGEYVLSQCFLLDSVAEAFGYLVVYVGVEESAAYVLECLGDVDLGYLAFALEYFP